MVVLGLRYCAWALSSCGEQGPLPSCGVQVSHCGCFSCCRAWALGTCALVIAVHRLTSRGTGAQLLHHMWNFPGPEIEPKSPALAGRFFTIEPPGKPPFLFFIEIQLTAVLC